MTLGWIVFGMAFIFTVLLIICLINADEVERHDEAVYYRWEDMEESEPPEWADACKWWESEIAVGKIQEGSITTDKIADDALR